MISRFFIDHPIFASVLAIVFTLAGLTAIRILPIEQYPNITPPLIQVTTNYNGANAQTMANDVSSPVEQQILGAENMIYMYSQNASTGFMTLSVYFDIDSNANMDQVNIQNLANQAKPQLPPEVQKEGLIIKKQTPNILLLIALKSPNGVYDEVFTSNFASINIVNELDLIPGISNISVIGARNYSMRIWLRPDRMAQLGLTANDVINSIEEQNRDFGIGQMGQAPNVKPVQLTIPMQTKGRLGTPAEFENIVLRADLDGAMVRIKDVAKVTLGAQDYSVNTSLDNSRTTMIAIYQQYGANALDVASAVKAKMKQLSKNFPKGLEYSIPYDTTLYINISIKEVIHTMFEAAILVILVVFIFLQSLRATLIPLLALIVSIIATFTGMLILGYTINTLTLFGMVLAIGIVVDDAIVVVENVDRNLHEHNLPPKEAAKRAMKEVTVPIIAIVFVLCAVFLPVAFLGGIAGKLYRQFAITLSISVIFSGLIALSLSPAIAALVLKPKKKEHRAALWFNTGLQKLTQGYLHLTGKLLKNQWVGITLFGCVIAAVFFFFTTIPKSFVPQEDQGYLITFANMPDGASLERTTEIDRQIQDIALKTPGVKHVVSLSGYSIIENLERTTIGTNFIVLKNWDKRKKRSLHAAAIMNRLNKAFYQIEGASITTVNPPAIQGLGTIGGFEFWIENRSDSGNDALQQTVQTFIEKAQSRKELTSLFTTAQFNNMQYYIDLDRYKTRALGVSVSDVFQTLQTLLGSVYVNNFNKFGRVYQVIVQAQPQYRERLENIGDMYVRSSFDKMVPLKSLIDIKLSKGANLISRFNDFPAAQILGSPAKGYTSGQAIKAMEEIAKEVLPQNMSYGWSGEAYQEIKTGGTSTIMLLAGMILVFLILAALYEKWSLPLAIIMAIPFGMLGALGAIAISGMSNDIYFQIGLVTLIALSAKNAILIVEFALQKTKEGMGIIEAALEAAKLRLRAILMTSLTFILGVTPLILSQGAGAASRHSVGVGVFGGMIAATFFAIFFIPLFFTLIVTWSRKLKEKREEK